MNRSRLLILLMGALIVAAYGFKRWLWAPPGNQTYLSIEPRGRRSSLQDIETHFLVVAGGGSRASNEIALEKNVHYFQRTLAEMGINPSQASVYFANGVTQEPTVRYVKWGWERFKPPDIPHLIGPATAENLSQWLQGVARSQGSKHRCQAFMYFTGHGLLNRHNPDNNDLLLWDDQPLSVQQLAVQLDRLPPEKTFVTMMAQCYSGSFANLIYRAGNPAEAVAPQTRCGFFATVKERPSVGCTPLVNEADYEDYSSSFFAGLSGRDRTGNPVPSADYDGDGQVTFAEAHAFSKVDAQTPDWPVSTLEAWLHRQATAADIEDALSRPLAYWQDLASPEQRYVIVALAQALNYNLARSFQWNAEIAANGQEKSHVAYPERLRRQLITVAMTQKVLQADDVSTAAAISVFKRLHRCEHSAWWPQDEPN